MNKHLSILLTTLWIALAQPSQAAPAWDVDTAKSSLTFKVVVNGETVSGTFPGFGAQIRFDPDDLAASSAKVVIDTSGIRTGDRTRDTMLLKPAWFNVLSFPQATFTCPKFVSNGPGKFVCDGKLTIKGISRDVKLPFTLDIQGQKAVARGMTTISRLEFKVGDSADFATGTPVALDVGVFVTVIATKAK